MLSPSMLVASGDIFSCLSLCHISTEKFSALVEVAFSVFFVDLPWENIIFYSN